MFDPHGTELSGERGTSTAFSGEGERHHRESSCLALLKCLFTNKEFVVSFFLKSSLSFSLHGQWISDDVGNCGHP